MPVPVLATKLYIPPSRSRIVHRPALLEQLDKGLQARPGMILLSAPAGFGKSTLVSEWIAGCGQPAAWLSLDEGDNDPSRFLLYFIAALQTLGIPDQHWDEANHANGMAANLGAGVLSLLQSPQPPPIESILTELLNEMAALPEDYILVLDDYHVIDSKPVDQALTFLLEHQPPQLHLVLATREDPDLPLAKLRAVGRLTELRAAHLRFTQTEAASFLNQIMGLHLSAEDIRALDARTEGWIAGLQLAALSMQGQRDIASFIQSFTGSHRFVMDYLVEEVLRQQPERVQAFLLRTSILERMCGPLCDAVLLDPGISGQATLEYLERSNLFIVPLDNERRWYRYHHLFADLLRQRLQHGNAPAEGEENRVTDLHVRASQWFEENGLQMEAFGHAAAAQDIERAERLADGKSIPLHLSGGVVPILEWLESLPAEVKNARPSLWWRHAAMMLVNGQTTGVAEDLQAAESSLAAILGDAEPDAASRRLIGRIAAASATLALTRYDVKTMLLQSRRALDYLEPENLSIRGNAYWTMGFAYTLSGDRLAARQAFMEAIALSQAAGSIFTMILATIGLAYIQELDTELHQAAETYRRVLEWAGDQPQQIINEVHIGLARINYEWNHLETAEQHAQQGLHLARQYESFIDRFVFGELLLARLQLARGNVDSAAASLERIEQSIRQHHFVHRMPEVAGVQVLTLLRQGNLTAAAHLAQSYELPLSQARVHMGKGNPSAALEILRSYRQQVETKGWKDEQLKTAILQALAYHALGQKDKSRQAVREALVMAEPGGFVRIFLDEGEPMTQLLSGASVRGVLPVYVDKLLAAFKDQPQSHNEKLSPPALPLTEPLSPRELEVLNLIAQGLSNDEIGKRLFLALDTVKGHNRRIFDKLQVQRRTEAVARARELGLL